MNRRRNEWQTAVQPNGKAVYIKMSSTEPLGTDINDLLRVIHKIQNGKPSNGSKSHFKRKHTIGIIG